LTIRIDDAGPPAAGQVWLRGTSGCAALKRRCNPARATTAQGSHLFMENESATAILGGSEPIIRNRIQPQSHRARVVSRFMVNDL
jgi:hypothetical protein